ncbi:nucleotide-diphosphate-sugar epimerase [Kitasatospora indigofera]|uniref:Nucleotide-diphosphate-sugar epimerase n=1 Tax=Kitasatospora indigofera TaxID=67307 RepID=A0A919GHG8_9ACTN|nr:NAD(P)H-binding protein [Kitasatospora indigofera]GHH84501.1 nucleotide-diphosphate-sugar epimerase [Kitasatospora indigofera]
MILITGATGAVGHPLTAALLARGAAVRAVTRDPAAARLPADVETFGGDPSRPASVAPALDGVTALFLHPRAVGDAAAGLVALARERGVRRVVALSALNVDDPLDEQPSRFRGDRNKEAEDAAAASGLEWTSIRASSFAGNALTAWGAQIRAGDVVRYVHPDFQESPVDERDLAEVAARALLTDEYAGRRLELPGPQSLSHREMVAVLGEALGRPLRMAEVPPEAAVQGMLRQGLPETFVRALMARYAAHLRRPQHPGTDQVRSLLGRPARTFADWAADHADAFRA